MRCCGGCMPRADSSAATGFVELHRVESSPFTVSVDDSGRQLFAPVITLANLPEPSTLGPYAAYIAWAVTPDLARDVKLGVVTTGRTELGVVGIERNEMQVRIDDLDLRGRLNIRGGDIATSARFERSFSQSNESRPPARIHAADPYRLSSVRTSSVLAGWKSSNTGMTS